MFSRYNIVNPNITSNVGFHNRYSKIIIPLIEWDQIDIITDIIKKKPSKHKINFSKRFRWMFIPITVDNVIINNKVLNIVLIKEPLKNILINSCFLL